MNHSWIKVNARGGPGNESLVSIECTHKSHIESGSHMFMIDPEYAYVGGDVLRGWMLEHAHEEEE